MKGGKVPKTAEQHKRDGTYQPCRHDGRVDAHDDKKIGPPPKWLDVEEKKIYRDMVRSCDNIPGFLSHKDTRNMAILARLHRWFEEGKLDIKDITTIRLMSREFGMTPDSRLRMRMPDKPKAKDPADELQKRRAAKTGRAA